jgi:hypothetical protein
MNTEPRDEWRCPRRDGERCACPGKPHYFTGDELRPRTIYQVPCPACGKPMWNIQPTCHAVGCAPSPAASRG